MMTPVLLILTKMDFTNVGLDPFDDPQEMPVTNKDDPIGANTDKEPIKLTLRKEF